jgi:4-coumarate--CoA ligase
LDEAGLGLDSLDQMGVRSALEEIFAVQGEPQLSGSARPTVADWAGFVTERWQLQEPTLWLRSSGTTGTPKTCSHRFADLLGEAEYFAKLVGPRRRVLGLVPGEHIYGLIWTVLLPEVCSIPVSRMSGIDRIPLVSGDLVVAAPDHWRALVRAGARIPADVVGINAAGPLGHDDKRMLLAAGLARMIDVYGSSETGGIGTREGLSPTYTLLPRWRFSPKTEASSEEQRSIVDSDGTEIDLPDTVLSRGTGFELGPRRDGMVQVAGFNVDPYAVASVLKEHPAVHEAAVRPGENGRLKAFLVPRAETDDDALRADVAAYAATRLPSHARPVAYRCGASLPKSALGKPGDWC